MLFFPSLLTVRYLIYEVDIDTEITCTQNTIQNTIQNRQ